MRQHRDPVPRLRFEQSMRVSLAPTIFLGHLSGECGPCVCRSGVKPDSLKNALLAKLKRSRGHCGCCEGYITLDISPGIFSEWRSFHRAAAGSSSYSKREVWHFVFRAEDRYLVRLSYTSTCLRRTALVDVMCGSDT